MASPLLQLDLKTLSATLLCALVLVLILSYFSSRKWPFLQKDHKHKATAPEASGGWPIFGHLPLLKGPDPPHRTLGAMADRTGPVFSIRVGSHRCLVVSNSESAKECFTTNDLVSASRPEMLAGKLFGSGAMFGLMPYGPYWRDIRKIATLELLSNRRINMLGHIRVTEVADFVKELYRRCSTNRDDPNSGPVLVEMKQRFLDLTLNVILRMVAGKRYSTTNAYEGDDEDAKESRLVQKRIREFFDHVGLFVPGDAIPWLKWLDLGGYEKAMKKTAKELDGFLGKWLEEHKRKRKDDLGDSDFMDVMLSTLGDSDHISGFNTDTINKATILSLISGGSDTTAITLTWAISLLLNNRHALKKAQDELDRHVGKTRPVEESDISKLQYLHAIVKETLRLYPPGPLSVPHLFTKDCTVGGFHVARGTRLLTNLWKIQTDPEFWPDPMEFRPERFLTNHRDVDVRGQHFELIPFGSGRRACPGTSFALQMVRFTLGRFLQAFEILTASDSGVDMRESFGLTNLKATPLEVLISPRLPTELFD